LCRSYRWVAFALWSGMSLFPLPFLFTSLGEKPRCLSLCVPERDRGGERCREIEDVKRPADVSPPIVRSDRRHRSTTACVQFDEFRLTHEVQMSLSVLSFVLHRKNSLLTYSSDPSVGRRARTSSVGSPRRREPFGRPRSCAIEPFMNACKKSINE